MRFDMRPVHRNLGVNAGPVAGTGVLEKAL